MSMSITYRITHCITPQVEAEAAGLKLAVNARGRAVASHFLRTLAF